MARSGQRRRATDDARGGTGDPLAALLTSAGRGDQAAFADLYDALAPLLHGIVLKVVRDPAQSEEVTQEAFIELWRLAPRYDESRGSVRSWAVTVAHRRAVDRGRNGQTARDRAERGGQKRAAQTPDRAQVGGGRLQGNPRPHA